MPKSANGSYYDMKSTYIFSRYTTDAGKYEVDSKEYSTPGIDPTSDKESKTFYEQLRNWRTPKKHLSLS